MASNYIPENESVVSSSSDPFQMDTETFPVCDQGHLVTMGSPENCWTCRMNEQERRRSDEKIKIDLYCMYLKCGLKNKEMMGVLRELAAEDARGPQFRTLEGLLQRGYQCRREMETTLKEWMAPVQTGQVSSSAVPRARRAATAAEEDLKGLYHGFNMIKRGEGYHCLCGGRFKDDLDLVRHLRDAMAYNSGSAVCICSVCGDKKRTCGGLRVHSRIDHQEMMELLWPAV